MYKTYFKANKYGAKKTEYDGYNDDGSPMEGIKPRPQTITKEKTNE